MKIRPISDDEFETYIGATHAAFGTQLRPEEAEEHRLTFEAPRSLAAFDGSTIVGTAGAYSLVLTVPGALTPMAGVTEVGVIPTHRRRGVLSSLMRRQLDDLRDRGEAVAGLWASEGAIYWRFGYGLAALRSGVKLERDRSAFARASAPSGRLRLVDRNEAMKAMPEVYERLRPQRPGMLDRVQAWWESLYSDPERDREGASALFFAVHETDGSLDGYVAYRTKSEWWSDHGLPASQLQIHELMAETPAAYADLWRFCFDMDLVREIEAWNRPVDEPLVYMLAEPRRLRLSTGDALWIRLVDVARALESRRYRIAGSLTFEVRDEFCPWNEGRYRLDGGPDGAACRRVADGVTDVELSAADLGAAFLGGTSFAALRRAGRILERTPDAVAGADALFRWDPQPWCPHVF